MNELEVLYEARAGIAPETYSFDTWASCTCGHIYRGAYGKFASGTMEVVTVEEGSVYGRALMLVLEAHGGSYGGRGPAQVSNLTTRRAMEMSGADSWGEVTEAERERLFLEAALDIINTTIEFEEERQEQARLDVLAATRELVPA